MNLDIKKMRKYADIAGSRMAYLDTGSGPVVVLGHSYLWDAEMWEPQIRALSEHYRVIVPELWGHGKSGYLPQGTHTLAQLAQHQLALLDMLNVERFAVAGLSVGGMWGVELALMSPSRVAGLVLLGTSVGSEPAPSKARYLAMLQSAELAGALPDPLIDAILPMFLSAESLAHRQDLVDGFRARLRETERENLLTNVIPLGRMIFERRDALCDLAQLRMPALVMTGAEDSSRPPAEGKEMATILGCEFVELPGAGHISTVEAPDEVNRRLLSFLGSAF